MGKDHKHGWTHQVGHLMRERDEGARACFHATVLALPFGVCSAGGRVACSRCLCHVGAGPRVCGTHLPSQGCKGRGQAARCAAGPAAPVRLRRGFASPQEPTVPRQLGAVLQGGVYQLVT